jgi:small subunit ribosomal protein S17
MVKKKKDEEVEGSVAEETAAEESAVAAAVAGEEVAVEAAPVEEEVAVEASATEEEVAVEAAPAVEEKPKKTAKKAEPKAAKKAAEPVVTEEKKVHKRAEKVGIVASDKMTKTVTVRVDRLVKHPVYRKYVKKRKKFMAHDEMGAKIGDKVRIVETRPLSARKRWRVVEIIQKAEL